MFLLIFTFPTFSLAHSSLELHLPGTFLRCVYLFTFSLMCIISGTFCCWIAVFECDPKFFAQEHSDVSVFFHTVHLARKIAWARSVWKKISACTTIRGLRLYHLLAWWMTCSPSQSVATRPPWWTSLFRQRQLWKGFILGAKNVSNYMLEKLKMTLFVEICVLENWCKKMEFFTLLSIKPP